MDEEDDSDTRYPWLQSSQPSWMRREVGADEEEEDKEEDVEEEEDDGDHEGEDEAMKDARHGDIAHIDAKPNGAATPKLDG